MMSVITVDSSIERVSTYGDLGWSGYATSARSVADSVFLACSTASRSSTLLTPDPK